MEKGETLTRVARKYNRSVTLLARLNGLNPQDPLKEGVYIFIPPPSDLSSSPQESKVSSSSQSSPVSRKPSEKSSSREDMQKGIASSEKYKSRPSQSSDQDPPNSASSPKASSNGFLWPVEGKIIREYSVNKSAPHKGIDIAAKKGATVVAAKSGKVIYSDDGIPGYGKTIIIDHGDKISSVYSHNSELLVKAGRSVIQGTAIALVGTSGRASDPHLHFEIRRNAVCVNPRLYLP